MLENATNRDLLTAWKEGSQEAAQVLVRRYMARLSALVLSRLSDRLARRLDADDVVMSAWRSFFRAVGASRVTAPDDDNLWPLLVTMTTRKLARQAARHGADRRAMAAEVDDLTEHWQNVVSREPTPAEAVTIADEVEQLMMQLAPEDREVLMQYLQGANQTTIARSLDRSDRTIRRSLRRIRDHFQADQFDLPARCDVERHAARPDDAGSDTGGKLPEPTMHFDQLLLQEMVGSGAFGKVYRSLYRPDHSAVAVKFLRRHLWTSHRAVLQLVHEFNLLGQLGHPGIVQVHGWGRTPHGSTFVVMEWIDGSNLTEHLSWFQSAPERVISCGLAVCDALEAAHASGIVHGDLTPGNILKATDGRYILTDFGFGRIAGQPSHETTGGTPGYLAPEQLSDAFGRIGPATDVFGLGGVLYYLATGRAPLTGSDLPTILANTLSATAVPSVEPLAPRTLSCLSNLIDRCLNKELASRPQSVAEVASHLRQAAQELTH